MIFISLSAFAGPCSESFSAMDANGDDLLSLGEIQAYAPDLTAEMFAQLDTDGSGAISLGEWTAACEAGIIVFE